MKIITTKEAAIGTGAVVTLYWLGLVGLLYTTFSLAFLGGSWHHSRQSEVRKNKVRDPKSRRMSFLGEIMAKGTYPEHLGVPNLVIYAGLYFDQLPAENDVAAAAREGLVNPVSFWRFRSTMQEKRGKVIWKTLEPHEVEVSKHIITKTVASEAEAVDYAQGILNDPLPTNQPLWNLHLVKNTGNGRSVILAGIHHSIGDGVSLIGVLNNLFKEEDGSPLAVPKFLKRAMSKNADDDEEDSLVAQIVDGSVLGLKAIASGLKVLGLAALPGDTACTIRGHPMPYSYTGHRTIVHSPDIPLALVKEIKTKTGTTINDVLTSALAGALRRSMEADRDPALHKPLKIRALLPYGFPRKTENLSEKESALRNLWTLVNLRLPVDQPSSQPIERLMASKKAMDALKGSPEAYVQRFLQQVGGQILPWSLTAQTAIDMMSRQTIVFTNVPGPDHIAYFAGKPVVDIQVYICNVITQLSVLSYNGQCKLNFVVDDDIAKSARQWPRYFMEELQALKKAC